MLPNRWRLPTPTGSAKRPGKAVAWTADQPLTLALQQALQENQQEITSSFKESLMHQQMSRTTALLEAKANRHGAMEQTAKVDKAQSGLAHRLELR